MQYKFGLESVLQYRKRREDEAQREFAEAQRKMDEQLEVVNQMSDRVDEVRNEIGQLQAEKGAHIERIRQLESFINGQKIRIENERAKARDLMQTAEEKRAHLVEVSQEKKALEKLKERRRQKFVKEQKKKEQKRADDLITMRFNGSNGQ